MGLLPKIWPTIIFNQFYGQNAKEDANFILMLFGFFFFFTDSYNIHFKKINIENIGIKVYF